MLFYMKQSLRLYKSHLCHQLFKCTAKTSESQSVAMKRAAELNKHNDFTKGAANI